MTSSMPTSSLQIRKFRSCAWTTRRWPAIHEATREAYKEECEVNPNFAKVYNSMMDYKEFSSAYREMLEGTDYNYGWGFDYDAAQ